MPVEFFLNVRNTKHKGLHNVKMQIFMEEIKRCSKDLDSKSILECIFSILNYIDD